MHHTGILILSKTRPLAGPVAGGVFQLQLFAFDRQGPLQVEPWRLVWTGEAAHRTWLASAAKFTPGTPLQVTAERARAHQCGRAGAEIVAHVISCEIAPQRNTGKREQLSTQEQTA